MYKINYLISVALLTSFLFIFVQCKNQEQETLAEIQSYTINTDDYTSRYQRFLTSTGISDRPSARQQLLDGMIGEILLLNLDENQDIFSNPAYQAMQERTYKELLLAYYRSEEVFKKISITDDDLRQEFLRVNERLSARHLFTRNREEAEKLYTQLQNGYTFAQLAPLVCTDDSLVANGGYIGYFTWGDMDPAFEEAAYNLKPGEISRPVRTDYGYSIIKLEDRVRHPLLTEDEYLRKKNSLRRMVYIRNKKQVEKKLINDIIQNLNISVDQNALNQLAYQLGIGSLRNPGDGEQVDNTKPVIQYGDLSMSLTDARQAINNLAVSNQKRIRSISMLEAALRGLAVQDWLVKDARSKGYDDAPEFLQKLELWSNEKFLQYKRHHIFENINVSDSSAYAYFMENRNEFVKEQNINVQEILVSSEKEARDIIDLLNDGDDFTSLAKKHSMRHTGADAAGVLGLAPVSRYGNLKAEFKAAKVNEIIGPLKVDQFYLIARILEREDSRLYEYHEVKDAIFETLKINTERQNFATYVDSLRTKYKVAVNDQLLMSLKIEKN